VKKETYECVELEIIEFQTEDVINTSNPKEDELPLNSKKP